MALNDCCYECNFTSLKRIGDITIGDAQQVKLNNRDFYNSKGTSLVLLNSKKGDEIFNLIKSSSSYVRVDLNEYIQSAMIKPAIPKRSPEEFWKDFRDKKFWYVLSKYAKHNPILNISYIYTILKRGTFK